MHKNSRANRRSPTRRKNISLLKSFFLSALLFLSSNSAITSSKPKIVPKSNHKATKTEHTATPLCQKTSPLTSASLSGPSPPCRLLGQLLRRALHCLSLLLWLFHKLICHLSRKNLFGKHNHIYLPHRNPKPSSHLPSKINLPVGLSSAIHSPFISINELHAYQHLWKPHSKLM